jgi:positive regulator of sigma E activity
MGLGEEAEVTFLNILFYLIPVVVFFWGMWLFVKWLYRSCPE